MNMKAIFGGKHFWWKAIFEVISKFPHDEIPKNVLTDISFP